MNQPTQTARFLTFPSATSVYGLGRSTLYRLAGERVIEVKKAGRRSLISTESLDRYIANLPVAEIAAPKGAA